MEVAIGLGGIVMFFVFFLVGICGTILWIWMLVDCAIKEPSEGNEKIVWVLIILFTHWVGALIYLLARRPERISRFGR